MEEADVALVRGPAAAEASILPQVVTNNVARAADGDDPSRISAGSAEQDRTEAGGPRHGGSEDDLEGSGEAHTDDPDGAEAGPTPGDLRDALVEQDAGLCQTATLALWISRGATDVTIVQDATVDQDGSVGLSTDGEAFPGSADLAVDGDLDFSIRQDARVDVDVTGWDGRVVTRITLDQDLALDQDFAMTVFVDGDSAYDVRVDQGLLVDQDISLSIALTEENGTLYVDMAVVERAWIDQDTSVLVNDDGDGRSEAAIVQDVEVAQDVIVSLDVEDSLDDLYDVSLGLFVRQAVDVHQDAEIWHAAGEDGIQIEVRADQLAELSQEIAVHLDFALG
ncbi:hypothetical protein MPEAHAMD_6012 [Methylobacterium frigidaeris]|uniref:Uncharacterized protein n=2 Tax=Methylobacterium frigidaeris TaxID=2038277 RepID=A0AA37M8E1_9HYPH|nr:hypothetical protein MPEAHAMD_6012 [Methylobacterium frigidaeris]